MLVVGVSYIRKKIHPVFKNASKETLNKKYSQKWYKYYSSLDKPWFPTQNNKSYLEQRFNGSLIIVNTCV